MIEIKPPLFSSIPRFEYISTKARALINQVYKNKNTLLFLVLSFIILSCGYSESESKKYLPGRYTYEIPSGELQILRINNDFTFKQTIYEKNKQTILYENKGKMYVENNRIEFENWLQCYAFAEQKLIAKPYLSHLTGPFWIRTKRNDNIEIIIFDQTNYIFRKNKNK